MELLSIFPLIDKLAGYWFDWRLSRLTASNPELQEFNLKKAEFDEAGFHLVAHSPA